MRQSCRGSRPRRSWCAALGVGATKGCALLLDLPNGLKAPPLRLPRLSRGGGVGATTASLRGAGRRAIGAVGLLLTSVRELLARAVELDTHFPVWACRVGALGLYLGSASESRICAVALRSAPHEPHRSPTGQRAIPPEADPLRCQCNKRKQRGEEQGCDEARTGYHQTDRRQGSDDRVDHVEDVDHCLELVDLSPPQVSEPPEGRPKPPSPSPGSLRIPAAPMNPPRRGCAGSLLRIVSTISAWAPLTRPSAARIVHSERGLCRHRPC